MKKKILHCLFIFIRNHYDNILMIIGFALTFFMLTNSTRLFLKLASLGETDYPYTLTYRVEDAGLTEADMNRLLTLFESQGLNCKIDGRYLRIGELFTRMPVSVYLSKETSADEESMEWELWRTTPNSVILGSTIEEFSYSDGDYDKIMLGGMEYSVFAYCKEDEIEDNSIFFCWDNLDTLYREELIEGLNEKYTPYEEAYIVLESNTPMETALNKFLMVMEDRIIPVDTMQDTNYLVSFQTELTGRVTGVLTVFSVVCCVLVTNLWMSRRMREYLIRRVFGYEMKKIVVLIVKESGRVALLSLLLAWVMEAVYLMCRNGYSFDLQREFLSILFSFLGAIVIQGIVLIWPVCQLIRIHPTQGAIDSIY